MGQIKTLLWKNFIWCARHPIKTAFFYLLPLFCCCFLFLTLALQDTHVGDCDYETFALPPSHPQFVLTSLACNRGKRCGNMQSEYSPLHEAFQGMFERHKTNTSTIFCPGLDPDDFNMTVLRVMKSCILERDKDESYDDWSEYDLIYQGHILYYPKSPATDKLFEIMAKNTDVVNALKDLQPDKDKNEDTAERKERMEKARKEFDDLKDYLLIKIFKEQMFAVLCFKSIKDRTMGFENRSAAIEYATSMNLTEHAPWAVVEFNNTGASFAYKIIPHIGRRHRQSTLILQALVESSAIQYLTGKKPAVHLEMKRLPQRCHKNPFVLDSANQTIGMVITLGFIVLAQTLASEISSEKVSGLLDFLVIAGVSKLKVRFCWIIFGLVFCLSVSAFVAIFFYFVSPVMLDQTPFSLFLFVSLVYGVSFLFLCLAVANTMPTAQKASITILILLFVTYLVPRWAILIQAVGYTGTKAIIVRVLSLLWAPIAIQIIYAYIFLGERDANPASWGTLFKSTALVEDDINGIGEILILMLIQCCVYFILSTELVGWCTSLPCKRKAKKRAQEDGVQDLPDIELMTTGNKETAGIEVEDLVKVYSNHKTAVNHLSVTFNQNQITAFLGHNGAGKSTTMNILTGMMKATSGTAIINGKDIHTHMTEIRKNLGFCPQHDIVYPDLTVAEHLHFYGALRKMPQEQVQAYSDQILTEMSLNQPADLATLSRNLSGGNRRKLSIAIAFLGDPTTVILDEPTSAIDPFSRRAIWDVILRYRSKSTLLISTHYMQEADLLGDRIAIIDEGQLKCYGTPMYLKAKFGTGSFIKVAHDRQIEAKELEAKLKEYIPVALVSQSTHESSYSVPLTSVRSEEMIHSLEYLERTGKDWNIVSFGLSESTMEQVFFNVTSEALAHGSHEGQAAEEKDLEKSPLWNMTIEKKTGTKLLLSQFLAMWVKRWDLIKRSKTAFVFQVLLPLMFTALMLFFVNIMTEQEATREQLQMHPWSLSHNETLVAFTGASGAFSNSLLKTGLGTKCSVTSTFNDTHSCSEVSQLPAPVSGNESLPCDCSHCPADAAGPRAPRIIIPSNDFLLYLQKQNMTTYLLKTDEKVFIGAIEISGHDVLKYTDAEYEKMQEEIEENMADDGTVGMFGGEYDYDDYPEEETEASTTATEAPEWANRPKIPADKAMMGDLLKNYLKMVVKEEKEVHTLWMYVDVPYNEGAPFARDSVKMEIPFLNAYSNVLLRSMLPENAANPEEYGITLFTEEVNFGGSDAGSTGDKVFKPTSGGILGMFSGLALLMPIFSTLVVIVNENSSGNKQLQITMGLNRVIYWLANFVWDFTLFMFSLCVMLLFMLGFPNTFNQDMQAYTIIAVLYGLGMTLLGYWFSFVFKTARNCITAVGNIAPWFSFAAFILLIFKREDWYEDINNRLLLFPPYFITETIMVLDFNQKFPFPKDIYSWDMMGKRVVAVLFFVLIQIVLITVSEAGLFSFLIGKVNKLRKRYTIDHEFKTDPDVADEEQKILEGVDSNENVIEAKSMVKYYPSGKKLAVSGVSFGVRKGQCFGLLGTNGAGKSTLFKMLSGFLEPNEGECFVLGTSLSRHPSKAFRCMGYCPQDDVLFERMTAGEHLHLYGRIRGISTEQRNQIVDTVIEEAGLGPHKTKNTNELSGGNKRKVNFAISVMDFPDIIFLDEMTTGLDPEARRAAWNLLLLAVKKGSSAIITSHSMEECEALCNRLVIMVNGRFKCLGGVQYLKDKYGNNYTIKLRIGSSADPQKLLKAFTNEFPETGLVEQHLGFLEVLIPAAGLRLSHLFTTIRSLKSEFLIEEFSVSQTTLEHVFVNMVKEQM